MQHVSETLRSYLFLIPLIVLVLTEFAKVSVRTVQEGESIWKGQWVKWLFRPGGHSQQPLGVRHVTPHYSGATRVV